MSNGHIARVTFISETESGIHVETDAVISCHM